MHLSPYGKITKTTLNKMADEASWDYVYNAPRSEWEKFTNKPYKVSSSNYILVKGNYKKCLGSAKNVYEFLEVSLTSLGHSWDNTCVE